MVKKMFVDLRFGWFNLIRHKVLEIKKTRPCVVVSPDEMAALKTAIVAPMTSKGFNYPT